MTDCDTYGIAGLCGRDCPTFGKKDCSLAEEDV